MIGYSEESGAVILTMTREDWHQLLITLVWATGSMRDPEARTRTLGLVNRLNVGNPNFIPYEIGGTQ